MKHRFGARGKQSLNHGCPAFARLIRKIANNDGRGTVTCGCECNPCTDTACPASDDHNLAVQHPFHVHLLLKK
ncbi:hypothetical protein D3C72_2322430 [compost metagenome]